MPMPPQLPGPIRGTGESDALRGPTQAAGRPRAGLAICLSGGGFRASIFHAGALRRLNELGLLSSADSISCVSGGSIIGGYLAYALVNGLQAVDGKYQDFDHVLDEFLPFISRDIRTLPALSRIKFWQSPGKAPRAIERYYEKLVGKTPLTALPERPKFIFCATDLFFATSWVCQRSRIGDYACGYVKPPPPEWTIAKAIALSSCFPPVFDPAWPNLRADQFVAMTDPDGNKRELSPEESDRLREARSKLTLTDGGVYDNLGLEPVWKRHATVLVSDGGKPLQQKYVPPGLRLMRYGEVIQNQVLALRKRWLIDIYRRAKIDPAADVFTGAYWGIMSATANYRANAGYGYSKGLAARIADMRTDLNAFSPNEVAVLDKHGYELADIAVKTHAPELIRFKDAPLKPRYASAKLSDELLVQRALDWSGSRIKSFFTSSSNSLLR